MSGPRVAIVGGGSYQWVPKLLTAFANIYRDFAHAVREGAAGAKGVPTIDTFVTEVSQDTWIYFPWDIDFQPVEPIVAERKRVDSK